VDILPYSLTCGVTLMSARHPISHPTCHKHTMTHMATLWILYLATLQQSSLVTEHGNNSQGVRLLKCGPWVGCGPSYPVSRFAVKKPQMHWNIYTYWFVIAFTSAALYRVRQKNLTVFNPFRSYVGHRPTLWFSCSRSFSWSLTLYNTNFLPPAYSPSSYLFWAGKRLVDYL
jgi:hypothetical protein